MSEVLLQVSGVSKFFGGFAALSGVDLAVNRGERLGLIGPNGSGKTTLINCISGLLTVDRGHIAFAGENITKQPAYKRARAGITRSFQIPKPFASMSVQENLCIPLKYAARSPRSGAALDDEAAEILDLIGLRDKADAAPLELTQIDMRKLELARALAGRPKLLILDEVMAGLAHSELDEILAILQKLNAQGITIIMIEHILRAVMSFSERLVVLDAGVKIAEGVPADIMSNKDVERAYLGE
jgi:branched-chain amino acid transport system ATP-binding protein